MFAGRNFGWALAAWVGVALAGCAMTQGNLASSTARLERSADALQDDARRGDASERYCRDAQAFAAEARDFRRTIEDRGADDEDVEEAFRELSSRYHALRDAMERSSAREVELDFKSVTEAYLDVERALSRSDARRERYAHDD